MMTLHNASTGKSLAEQIGRTQTSTYINKKIQLNNSYYIKHIDITPRGSEYYWESMIYGYQIVDIDRDKHPDILLWTLKNIMIWSYNKGVYSKIGANYYFDNPIPLDTNHDGTIDKIILLDHYGYDGKTIPIYNLYRVKTIVKVWEPMNNRVKTLGVISSIAISRTYLVYNDRIYIPTIKNYYRRGWRSYIYFYSKLGILVIDTETMSMRHYIVKSVQFRSYNPKETNDITTSYEAYIIKYRDNQAIMLTSGWDKLIIIRLGSTPRIIREISLQNPQKNRDKLMIVIRKNTLTHSPGAHDLSLEYTAPQQLNYYIDENKLIIPYTIFSALTPQDRIYGFLAGKVVYDNPRIEKTMGVIVVDLTHSTYKYYKLRDMTIKHYTIKSITGLRIVNDKKILVGALGHDNIHNRYTSMLIEYKYDQTLNQWIPHIIHTSPIKVDQPRKQPIIPIDNNGNLITTNYLYINGTMIKYHSTKTNGGPYYSYLLNPPPIHPPKVVDIDGDGDKEIINIVEYQAPCGTSFGDPPIFYLVPFIRYGWNKLLIVEKPKIRINISGSPIPGGSIEFEISTETSKWSKTKIELLRDGETIYSGVINGTNTLSIHLDTLRPGTYKLTIHAETAYWANHVLGEKPNLRSEYIVYRENIELELFTVKIPTRILILEPKYHILTPNHYLSGLVIKARLQVYNYTLGEWVTKPVVDKLVAILYREGYTYRVNLYYKETMRTYYGKYYFAMPDTTYNITIQYNGDNHYTASYNSTVVQLIKYPTRILIEEPEEIPALTTTWFRPKIKYLYIDQNGLWREARLGTGSIRITIKNPYRRTTYWKLYMYNHIYYIDKYYVIPPYVEIKITYKPLFNYYSPSTNMTTITVKPLTLRIIYNKTMIWGINYAVKIIEECGNVWRKPSAPINIQLVNNTGNYTIPYSSGVGVIDTMRFKPGIYKLVVRVSDGPLAFSDYLAKAYNNPYNIFNTTIIMPEIKLEVTPYITIKDDNEYTYTLTPVRIKAIVTGIPDNISILVRLAIDGKELYVKGDEELLWSFKRPGKHIVKAAIYGETAYTTITVYPQKVWIIYRYGGETLRIYTRDLLDRYAPGNLTVRIYKRNTLIRTLRIEANGSAEIPLTFLPGGVYYVEATYSGNISYSPATNYTIIKVSGGMVEPLPEPNIIPITLLATILLLIIWLRRRNG